MRYDHCNKHIYEIYIVQSELYKNFKFFCRQAHSFSVRIMTTELFDQPKGLFFWLCSNAELRLWRL